MALRTVFSKFVEFYASPLFQHKRLAFATAACLGVRIGCHFPLVLSPSSSFSFSRHPPHTRTAAPPIYFVLRSSRTQKNRFSAAVAKEEEGEWEKYQVLWREEHFCVLQGHELRKENGKNKHESTGKKIWETRVWRQCDIVQIGLGQIFRKQTI